MLCKAIVLLYCRSWICVSICLIPEWLLPVMVFSLFLYPSVFVLTPALVIYVVRNVSMVLKKDFYSSGIEPGGSSFTLTHCDGSKQFFCRFTNRAS